jgi:hypothetical protein
MRYDFSVRRLVHWWATALWFRVRHALLCRWHGRCTVCGMPLTTKGRCSTVAFIGGNPLLGVGDLFAWYPRDPTQAAQLGPVPAAGLDIWEEVTDDEP